MCADGARAAYPLFQAGDGGSRPTSALQLRLVPIDLDTARRLNRRWHSRFPRFGTGAVKKMNKAHLCYGAEYDGVLYAVAIWSKPAARKLPQKTWLELRRFAIAPDAPKNTASRMLRIMRLLIRRDRPHIELLISFQDVEAHEGTIYKAAGWRKVKMQSRKRNHEWNCKTRKRPKAQSVAFKQRWEIALRDQPSPN